MPHAPKTAKIEALYGTGRISVRKLWGVGRDDGALNYKIVRPVGDFGA